MQQVGKGTEQCKSISRVGVDEVFFGFHEGQLAIAGVP
jgi:hypothetical protein